jgi:hypothetical protein
VRARQARGVQVSEADGHQGEPRLSRLQVPGSEVIALIVLEWSGRTEPRTGPDLRLPFNNQGAVDLGRSLKGSGTTLITDESNCR